MKLIGVLQALVFAMACTIASWAHAQPSTGGGGGENFIGMPPHCGMTSNEYKELYRPTCFAVPLVLIGTQECPTEDEVDEIMVGMNGDTSCPTQCNQNDQCVKPDNTVVQYDYDYMGTGGATQVNLYAQAGPDVEGRVPNPLGSSTCFLVKDCCCVETQQGTACVTITFNRVFQLTRYAASDVLCIGAPE